MTPPLWRSPAIAVGIGVGVGAVASGGLLLLGFGVRMDVWVLTGLAVAVTVWFFRDVFDPGHEPPMAEPHDAPSTYWSIDSDRRTRTLEGQVRGALRGNATTVTALHHTIDRIARASDAPLPPATARYLASEPHPLTRAQVRTIIRELTQR